MYPPLFLICAVVGRTAVQWCIPCTTECVAAGLAEASPPWAHFSFNIQFNIQNPARFSQHQPPPSLRIPPSPTWWPHRTTKSASCCPKGSSVGHIPPPFFSPGQRWLPLAGRLHHWLTDSGRQTLPTPNKGDVCGCVAIPNKPLLNSFSPRLPTHFPFALFLSLFLALSLCSSRPALFYYIDVTVRTQNPTSRPSCGPPPDGTLKDANGALSDLTTSTSHRPSYRRDED